MTRPRVPDALLALLVVWSVAAGSAAAIAAQHDWPTYGHDKGAQRYSPLAQIDSQNVSKLTLAWTFDMQAGGDVGPVESTPLVVNGVMYLSWPYRHVAAIDPDTGAALWTFTAPGSTRGPLSSMRSVDYWPGDRRRAPRILFGTEDGGLYALDARSGEPVPEFGRNGVVNLKTPDVMNGFPHMHLGISSAPLVYKNLVFTGSHIVDETGSKGPAGDVRAWDARTGRLVWTFHTVPRPGEAGHDTWPGDTWRRVSGANMWTSFSIDTKRGILYMPLGSVNNDYYGVDRPGPNLFANSLVAVDADTGRLKWYFQAVHHDLWDYDMPVPPVLFDVVRGGKRIPAVGVMAKNALLFILDRSTGTPIYGVEERPVPRGDVPDESYSPTQPFPLKPPALSRMSFTPDDVATITPEHEAACREAIGEGGRNRGPFTPPSTAGALNLPTEAGGAEWGGAAFDPVLGYYLINTTDSGGFAVLRPQASDPGAPRGSPRLFERRVGPVPTSINGWPCWQPPWGRLTAIDVNTGDIAWQVPFGTMAGLPEGLHTGAGSVGGPIATAGGLTFIGAADDRRFRAFETRTGRELWAVALPEVAHSVPITYQGRNGKQYVSVAAGAKLFTFALP